MRIYEELFVVRPDATDELMDPFIEQIRGVIEGAGGKVDKAEKWGKRRLAYRVEKCSEGFYILLQFQAKPETVAEVERRMRVTDLVIKFITVRIDEKLKRIEKRKKVREKRAARKPAPVAHTPQQPTAEQQMLGGTSPMPGEPAAAAE